MKSRTESRRAAFIDDWEIAYSSLKELLGTGYFVEMTMMMAKATSITA